LVDYEWPVDAGGKKWPKTKIDIGQLPFDHPIIIFFSGFDPPNPLFRQVYFGLANSLKVSTCTTVDAYRLKRSFSCL
jgi:hypothetical protein